MQAVSQSSIVAVFMSDHQNQYFDSQVHQVQADGQRFLRVSMAKPAATKDLNFDFIAGQYCIVQFGSQKTYLAIASDQKSAYIDFLIDNKNSLLPSFQQGNKLQVSFPLGSGFPLEKRKNKHVYIITHGSGLSAFIKVIDEFLSSPNNFLSMNLFYGIAHSNHLPFAENFEKWAQQFDLKIAYSQQENRCYVQKLLQEQNYHDIAQSVALVVGSKEMTQEVKEILFRKGFQQDQILFNF